MPGTQCHPTPQNRLESDLSGLTRWWHHAACRNADPELFFSEKSKRRTAEAIAICTDCPVQYPCLLEARLRAETSGVWGGRVFTSSRGGR